MKLVERLLGVAFVAFLLTACSKEQLEIPESNAPVFTVDGTFGGDDISLIAGDEGAYMFTHTQVMNGVKFYSGMISNGSLSVELGIYDGMLDIPNHQPELELTNINPLCSQMTSQPITILSKNMFSNSQNISSIVWSMNGVVVGTNNVEVMEAGHFNVCAEITYYDSSTETLCNDMILGYDRSANFSIEFTSTGGYIDASLSDITPGLNVTSVEWYLDNSLVSTNVGLNLPAASGAYELSAVLHFSNGAIKRKNVLVNCSDPSKNIEDFTMFEEMASTSVQQDFNYRLKIINNGQIYDSHLAENGIASLDILDIEYYGPNSNGNSVYKIHANVDAMVRTANSTKQIPVSFTTVFGVEIP